MKRIIQLFLFTLFAFSADAQRIKLLQFERYLGDTIPFRSGYVGLTNTSGDQEYKKLDSIIARITDSLIADLPDEDTDEQYFDTAMISGDTLILSIIRDGVPAHRIILDGLSGDHDWYEVGTTTPPDSIGDEMYNLGKVTIGDNASYTEDFAVPLSDIRVQEIIIGYSADGESSNLRIGKNSLLNNVFGSGLGNTAIGLNALENNTTGDDNFALGARSLKDNTTGNNNVAIGADAMVANVDGFTNVALGSVSLSTCTLCDYNIAIGFGSMFDKSSGDYNIGIGSLSLAHNDSSFNVAIGFQSMFDAQSSENVAVGWNALYGTSNTGARNVALGFQAGRNARGAGNVFLGYNAGRNTSAASFASGNKLYIENTDSNSPLIWGDFTGDSVRINGSLMVTNRLGVATVLAGWRGNDGKAVETGLGTGLSVTSGVLNYTPLIDQFEIVDDTLYISETGDGVPPFFVDLKSYIDTATAGYDTDSQSISQFYVDMDSLIISLQRGNRRAVFLGDLISIVETDNQRFDSIYLDACTLIVSPQRDSVPAYEIDLCSLLDDTDTDDQYFDSIYIVDNKLRISIHDDGLATHVLDLAPYLSSYAHAGTAYYQNTLYNGASYVGAFMISPGTGIGWAHDGIGNSVVSNTGMITWFLDGLDDAFASTEIFTGNV
ncbi:MAG TPA: hypothetical protein PLR30_12450, partial [Saprospiraceae bacterium]|nr:hypothetical protein [Saprospiraceae bacterium]